MPANDYSPNMEILKTLADNPQLLEAVKKTMLSKFEFGQLDSNTSTEKLGEYVKARLQGIKMVEEAFAEIELHKTVKVDDSEIMPSR